jgi:hypothetical protein
VEWKNWKTRGQTHDSTKQIDKDKESHRETAKSKQFRQDDKLAEIMNCRIDPPPTLREQYTPRFRSHGVRNGMGAELGLEGREMLHQESRQETIFTKGKQILLMQSVDIGFGVFFDDSI